MNVKTLMMLGMTVAAGAELAGGVPLRDATIVVPDATYKVIGQYRLDESRAVFDLTNALAKVTGGKYRVIPESQCKGKSQIANRTGAGANCTGAGVIYLGDTAAARAVGAVDETLKNNEAKIVTKDGKVCIWAKTGWGVSRGVLMFLHKSVDFWYLTLTGNDPYVFNPEATAPEGEYYSRSWLQNYQIYHGMFNGRRYPTTQIQWANYSRRLGVFHFGGNDPKYTLTSLTPNCHSSFAFLPPEKYFKDHPEYYALRPNGKKTFRCAARSAGGQLCYTNPDTRRLCYEALRSYVLADRKKHGKNAPCIYDFTQQDYSCGLLCVCSNCLETAAKYDRDGGYKNGGWAGLQLDMVNEMARKIRAEFPEVHIRTFAYAATEVHPINIEPEENVIIWVCDFCNTDALYPLTDPVNKSRKAYMDSWGLTAKRLHIWDYFIYGWQSDVDYPSFYGDAIAADMRLYRNYPLEYVFWESEYHNRAFHELNYFVASEVVRDPDQSVDDLVRIYCRVYGRAAAQMEAIVSRLRKVMRENPPQKGNGRPWLTVANMEKMRGDLLSAYARAETAVAKARVAKVIASCEFYLAGEYRKKGRTDEAVRAREAFKRYEKEHTALALMEEKDRREALATGIDERADLASLRFKHLPPELENVPANDLICLDYRTEGGPIVDDRLAEKGKAGVWGKGEAADAFHGFPIGSGFYDQEEKKNLGHFALALPNGAKRLPAGGDREYRWYKAGTVTIGRKSIFWFQTWTTDFQLRKLWQDPEEVGEDRNTFEVWASVRAEGPAYVEGATGENRLYFDRAALRRVKK